MSFFKSKEEKNRGIYLPVGDEEENKMKSMKTTKISFKRPHLTLLLLLIGMITSVICIGFYMFTLSNERYSAFDNSSSTLNSNKVAPLILISIDGFRYNYLHRGLTPNLKKLSKQGIHGPMKPQFPSYTFPNHFTLVTGLYPESHGIVANAFYDPKLKEYFSYTNQEDLKESKWWQAEPIWNTVQRFGMLSATMFWPGSESSILGKRPNYFKTYDGEIATKDRVDQVLQWLDLPIDKRPKFLSMYLSLVDDAGHFYGPDSKEVDKALKEVDFGIGRLIEGLKERNLFESANILVVSDHGMVEVKGEDKFHIYLDDLIPDMKDRLQWVDFGPMASIIPLEGEEDSIFTELVQAKMRGVPFMVYRRDDGDIPPDFHYDSNDRIAPIIIVAQKGWIVDFRGGDWVPRGAHGYDPNLPEMQALFIASGPEFRTCAGRINKCKNSSLKGKGISNLDVYPLMMHLLKINPTPPNNGTLTLVNLIK